MPHKRAKRSVREQQRSERGSDLAPGHHSLENETIPKSVARVLNSLSVRQQWKTNKRKAEDGDNGEGKGKGKRRKTEDESAAPKILPGESLQHFNKRVEQDMRPLVRSAVQSSLATTRKAKAEELDKKKKKKLDGKPQERSPSPAPPPPPKHADRPKDFVQLSTSAPKRLNDIAQAPPEFKLKKVTKTVVPEFNKHSGVLSMAQKAMMEAEREKAIARYRQIKADRKADAETILS